MAPRRPRKKSWMAEATTAAAAADVLISLPPEVLDEILTRLDLRDAVRTSVLSRAWRRRWESLPSLDIDMPLGETPLWAVNCVLLRCTGRVRRFHVDLDEISVRLLQDWLLVLSRRGVEDLNLSPHKNKFFSLPSTVFSCRRLISLDLFICEIPPLPPGFDGFPDLKVLSLANVKLQQNGEYQLEEIIETSPLLEKLILCEVYIDGDYFIEWEIRAPNLRHLTICSPNDYGWNLPEMSCLRSAVIDSWEYVGDRDFAKFLAGLVHVRKLRMFTLYAPVNGVKILETLPCTFDNLKSLKLFMHFCELPPILLMFCLLKSAPNLEKLKILILDGKNQKIETTGEFLNAHWDDGMCAKLQVLQMTGINWLPNEMSFMKLILSKAQHLRTLSISHDEECLVSHDDPLQELLKYTRASAQAQVLFKGPGGAY
uniref:F-box domain-containing protein n=1 Tax=Arundo donax TaxID=35708 RepID=A0A0A9DCY2_ARUDO